jgi:DNA-binding transcriptional regulator of glucitol operon
MIAPLVIKWSTQFWQMRAFSATFGRYAEHGCAFSGLQPVSKIQLSRDCYRCQAGTTTMSVDTIGFLFSAFKRFDVVEREIGCREIETHLT